MMHAQKKQVRKPVKNKLNFKRSQTKLGRASKRCFLSNWERNNSGSNHQHRPDDMPPSKEPRLNTPESPGTAEYARDKSKSEKVAQLDRIKDFCRDPKNFNRFLR